ncbi:DUF4118 domain-containing protein [Uliginosibacterium sp. TH139]|uniref:DUF4118 domain-containing protein n=1 Tax=Uliginosibacterium sp. TH139 TaxID=2067453 RepID=UPI000C7DAFEE|nr:DUF4118 domain-containing protein [Uliginosibacterium sp. TH139]PLK48183.1 hypothetical protein C0V76_13195 [Uliginosibacterium sp. TH139]
MSGFTRIRASFVHPLAGYAVASLGVILLTAITLPLSQAIEPTNLVMLYLLLVVGIALRFSQGPAAWCAISGVLAFDFFHIPPRLSLAVGDVQYLLTFAVMLLVGLLLAHLTARLREQAVLAEAGERSAQRQYALARELAGCIDQAQVPPLVAAFMARELQARAELWWLRSDERLVCLNAGANSPDVLRAMVETVLRDGQLHEQADLFDAARRLVLLPLDAPMRRRGVLLVSLPQTRLARPQRQMLEAVAVLVAIALERLHYVKVAQAATLDMERERLRSTILAALSHDVRTPLTIMVGQADALCEAEGAPARALALALREQAMRMSELVNNLLDMARLQSGGMVMRRDWQSLEEIIGAATAHLGDRLSTHKLEIALPPQLPLLEFDAVLIERVLCNLLENAAKFSPAGSTLRMAAELQADAVRVSVEDEGPGLPAGQVARLFEPFVRGEGVAHVAGLGLGLSICRVIVEAHGGRLTAANREVGGAGFAFTLPRSEPPPLAEEVELPDA